MDATFPVRRSFRTQAIAGLLVFPAWAALWLYIALTDPGVPHRLGAAALGGIPLLMAGLSLWLLLATWRASLAIAGPRLVSRGVLLREIDVRDVTRARWQPPPGGAVVLRTPSSRLAVRFADYEPAARDPIVQHLRSMLRPEVQVDWNLFAYKLAEQEAQSARTKPGPGEVLLRRDRWDRLFGPAVLVFALAGLALWVRTGEVRYLVSPLFILVPWGFLRFTTPSGGMIAHRLTAPRDPGFLLFLLAWGAVGLGGLLAVEVFRPRLAHADMVMMVWTVFWSGVTVLEGGLADSRRSRREREAADLAAKARGESLGDSWRMD